MTVFNLHATILLLENDHTVVFDGSIAQLVEQRIENPRVGGSIPPRATKISKTLTKSLLSGFFYV
jgi:hypothetical protein